MDQPIEGFSKLTKEEKIRWIATRYTQNAKQTESLLKQYWNNDSKLQQLHDEFIENTISNFYLPLGVAPNFSINDRLYAIPMAIEESSVVAAASKAAKFWLDRGGFRTTILGTEKIGQVHFLYFGEVEALQIFITEIQQQISPGTISCTVPLKLWMPWGQISSIPVWSNFLQPCLGKPLPMMPSAKWKHR